MSNTFGILVRYDEKNDKNCSYEIPSRYGRVHCAWNRLRYAAQAGRSVPKTIRYLGTVLPYSIMAMLVVYCLKDTFFAPYSGWLPAVLSVLGVVVLHIWKRNTLLSIVGGTACYMLLIRFML